MSRINLNEEGDVDSDEDSDLAFIQVADEDNTSFNASNSQFANYAVLYSKRAVQVRISNS